MKISLAEFHFFEPPVGERLSLPSGPLVDRWEAGNSKEQKRLRAYEAQLDVVVRPNMTAEVGLALDLSVGLPEEVPLTSRGRDLDNYLFPILRQLGQRAFVSAWATKGHGASWIRVGPVAAPLGPPEGWTSAGPVETTSSTQRSAWKAEVAAHLSAAAARHVALEVQVAFVVHPRRNWTLLWKPTIDAMAAILGSRSGVPYHPDDDRNVRLGLHRRDNPDLGDRVRLAILWRPAPTNAPASSLPKRQHRDGTQLMRLEACRPLVDRTAVALRGRERRRLAFHAADSPGRPPGRDRGD